jgi:Rod binding domain-containing protein
MTVLALAAAAPPREPTPLPPSAAAPRPLAADPTFDGLLRAAGSGDGPDEAREAAEKFVSIAFIEPVLASLRESALAEGPFAPSDAERRFSPMLHQHLADRIVASANFPLVDRVVAQLTSRGGNGASAAREVLPLPEQIDVHG